MRVELGLGGGAFLAFPDRERKQRPPLLSVFPLSLFPIARRPPPPPKFTSQGFVQLISSTRCAPIARDSLRRWTGAATATRGRSGRGKTRHTPEAAAEKKKDRVGSPQSVPRRRLRCARSHWSPSPPLVAAATLQPARRFSSLGRAVRPGAFCWPPTTTTTRSMGGGASVGATRATTYTRVAPSCLAHFTLHTLLLAYLVHLLSSIDREPWTGKRRPRTNRKNTLPPTPDARASRRRRVAPRRGPDGAPGWPAAAPTVRARAAGAAAPTAPSNGATARLAGH